MRAVYFDNNATTQMDPEVYDAMQPFFKGAFGNPSSSHSFGRAARAAIDRARESVAALIGADSREVIFTSGATESNNTFLNGITRKLKDKGRHIVTSQIEHKSVLNACKSLEADGFDVTFVGVDPRGVVDTELLKGSLREDTVCVAVMSANNETGVLQPVAEIADIAREKDIVCFSDIVQSVGKVPVDVKTLGLDAASFSAHKFYGPKGIGALYLRRGLMIPSLLKGGYQERNLRAGTENVAAIVGMGKAAEIALKNLETDNKRIAELKARLSERILKAVEDVVMISGDTGCLSNTLSVSFSGVDAEAVVLSLDSEGIAIASGSACASGASGPSHVLEAMKLPKEVIDGAVRISLGRYNTDEEADLFMEKTIDVVERLKRITSVVG